jgi:hypothetical protein
MGFADETPEEFADRLALYFCRQNVVKWCMRDVECAEAIELVRRDQGEPSRALRSLGRDTSMFQSHQPPKSSTSTLSNRSWSSEVCTRFPSQPLILTFAEIAEVAAKKARGDFQQKPKEESKHTAEKPAIAV